MQSNRPARPRPSHLLVLLLGLGLGATWMELRRPPGEALHAAPQPMSQAMAHAVTTPLAVVASVASIAATASAPPAQQPARGDAGLHYVPGAPQLESIRAVAVNKTALPVGAPLSGHVVYDEDVTLRISAPLAGRVTAVYGDVGTHVRRQAALLQLDSPDAATAQSDYLKARAVARLQAANVDRLASLAAVQAVPGKDLVSARADLAVANAETVRASQKLRSLALMPPVPEASQPPAVVDGRFALRAPIGGVIVDRQVNNGMEVRPDLSNSLFTITDPERMWVVIDLPERSLPGVAKGQSVEIRADAWPGVVFKGRVDAVLAAVDATTRRAQVRCRVDNPGAKLKADMYVRVALLAAHGASGFEVPNTALVLQAGEQWVVVETAPGSFVRRRVTLASSGPESSFVETGLADGDKVVTEGALLLLNEFATNAR